MAEQKILFCTKCGAHKQHKYVGRARGTFLEDLVIGSVSLKRYQLLNGVSAETVRKTAYWECTECKKVTEIS